MNSSVSPSCDFRGITKASALPGYTYVDGRKCEHSWFWKIVLLLHPYAKVSYSWLLRNLSLGGKLCLRDEKNTVFV